jgi:hypothetical protein
MAHILFNLNDYIDPWINTQLVHFLYLKSMEGHLLMIDCEKISCKIFFFCINILTQVAMLAGDMDYFPFRGF